MSTSPSPRPSARQPRPAGAGIALLSWTFPRVGPFKFTEVLALLNAPAALTSARTLDRVVRCYGPFIVATVLAAIAALFTLGQGDNSLTSTKGLYTTPESTLVITILRTVAYLLMVTSLTHFFRTAPLASIQKALSWAYFLTLLPGFLQMLRMYSGIHFDIPYFEREGYGPFSGVFDAGYLRLMGFEFEPLGYATSLMIICCLRLHARGRIPVLGLIVLGHTFSAGAFAAIALALVLGYSNRMRSKVVPVYLAAFVTLCVVVWTHLDELLDAFLLLVSVSERINALGACINMWLDYPFGVGPGLYGYFLNVYDRANLEAQQLDFYPNNDPAMFLATGGVLYLLAYLWIYHYLISSTRARWIRFALVALLVQSISSYLIFNPAAAVIMSLALAARELPHPVRKLRRRRSAAPVAAPASDASGSPGEASPQPQ